MNVRVLCNYLLVILGLRKMLPRDVIRSKVVKECGEPMVRLAASAGLFLNGNVLYCRLSVAERLRNVAAELGTMGLGLYIYELYRSPEEQQVRYQKTYRQLEGMYPDVKEREAYARRCTAGVGGGHQTGAAVDLTLCGADGSPLDMGSVYPDKCPEMVTSCRLDKEVMSRRKLLCAVMRKAGFVNYPGEWWHFSYGDRMWAAYRYRRFAIYDVVEKLPE